MSFNHRKQTELPCLDLNNLSILALSCPPTISSRGDCNQNKDTCCREQYFINFRTLTWTQYWIIEPAGYQAFRCTGSCRQPKRNYGYGERRCTASESAPLPIMYLVKKGEYTEIEVAEFPNMIVERCACTMDNVSIV